jgi:hypothetical protein
VKTKHIIALVALLFASALPLYGELVVADNGKTSYSVVTRIAPMPREAEAADDLVKYLTLVTGAKFRLGGFGKYRIYVGVPAPGDDKPFKRRETRIKSVGSDIYLYGEGPHGHADAVYDFLEDLVGCRWYTARGDEYVPKKTRLAFDKLDYSRVPSFVGVTFWGGWPEYFRDTRDFYRRSRMDYGFNGEYVPLGPNYFHSPSQMMPPGVDAKGIGPTNLRPAYKYFKDNKYFITNPEYFTMTEDGRRTVHQLCYSNPELRKELIKNYEIVIAREYQGGEAVIVCDLNDNNGVPWNGIKVTCACPGCLELVKKYKDGAGPYYDFLFYISEYFKKKYPLIKIKGLAYMLSEFPVLGVERFPDNIIIDRSPLWKNFLKPMSHLSNAMMLMQMKAWAKKCGEFQFQMYPTIYPRYYFGSWPLVANVYQLAENLRVSKKIGVARIAGECGFFPFHQIGFNDLRFFVLAQLSRDVTRDERKLAEEFFTRLYGKAAPLMIKYYNEIEKCEAEEPNFMRWCPDPRATLSYLTPENLTRWEAMFDEMEVLTADQPRALLKVRTARMNLDETLLLMSYKFPEGKKPDVIKVRERWNRAYGADMDDLFRDPKEWGGKEMWRRIGVARYRGMAMELYTRLARGPKPLPEKFVTKQNGRKIYQLMPAMFANQSFAQDPANNAWRFDNQAAFGISFKRLTPLGDKPLNTTALQVHRHDSITLENGWDGIYAEPFDRQWITPDVFRKSKPGYQLYYLGKTMLWPDCMMTVYRFVPGVYAPAGYLYDPAHPRKVYDIYGSFRFDAPDGLSCDQVVLVEGDEDCKQMQEIGI